MEKQTVEQTRAQYPTLMKDWSDEQVQEFIEEVEKERDEMNAEPTE